MELQSVPITMNSSNKSVLIMFTKERRRLMMKATFEASLDGPAKSSLKEASPMLV